MLLIWKIKQGGFTFFAKLRTSLLTSQKLRSSLAYTDNKNWYILMIWNWEI